MFWPRSATRVETWPTMLGTFWLTITRRRVPGSRGSTASGKLTALWTWPSSRKPRSSSTAITAQLRSASLVEAPRWGSEMHLGCLCTAVEGKSHT